MVLPALIVVGAVAAKSGRNISRRFMPGLLLLCVAGIGIYAGSHINALIGRARSPQTD